MPSSNIVLMDEKLDRRLPKHYVEKGDERHNSHNKEGVGM